MYIISDVSMELKRLSKEFKRIRRKELILKIVFSSILILLGFFIVSAILLFR